MCRLLIALFAYLLLLSTQVNASYKNSKTMTSLFEAPGYIQKNSALSYWRTFPYFITEIKSNYAAVATMTMQLNAALANKTARDNITQTELIDKQLLSPQSTTLDQYGKSMENALNFYHVDYQDVQTYHADAITLKDFEKTLDNFNLSYQKPNHPKLIAINFFKSDITGWSSRDAKGSWAVISAYDDKLMKVLIVDPDQKNFEPYWADVNTLYHAMLPGNSKVSRGYVITTIDN